MRYQIVVLGIVILILSTSCASSSDSGGVVLESARDNNKQVIPTDAMRADENNSVAIEKGETWLTNLEDILIYTTDYTLFIWNLAVDEQPLALDFIVDGEQIYTDPDQSHIFFGTIANNQFGIHRLNLNTYNTNLITHITNRSFFPNWAIQSWSPNQAWMLVNAWNVGVPLGFVRVDGSMDALVKLADSWRPTYWTTDNQIILIEIDDQFRTDERRFSPFESITNSRYAQPTSK